jgi:hypothetical protein
MADAVTAAIGAIIMIGYILLIAFKLAEVPFWIITVFSLGLMMWAFWQDDWRPIIKKQ